MLPHFSALFRTSLLLDTSTLFRTFPHFSALFRTFPHFSAFSAFSLFSLLTYSLFVFRTFRFFRSIFRTSAPLHSDLPSLDASALFRIFPHFTFLIVNLFIVRFLIVLLFHCSLFCL